jgi:hypothetical protein
VSDQLRELVRPFGDVEPPLDLRARISQREALVAGGRPPVRLPRPMVVAIASLGVVLVIGALALAAHTRSTAPPNEGSNTKLGPVTQAQMNAFLTSVRTPLRGLNTQILIANTALNTYKANPTAATALTWRQVILDALHRIGHDGRPLKAIDVPRALKPAWTRFAESESNDAGAAAVTGSDLGTNATPDLLPLNYLKPIEHLRTALVLSAAANHLKLPSWVRGLGTGAPRMPIVYPVKHPGPVVFMNILAPRLYKLQQDITFATSHLDTYKMASTTPGAGSLEGLRMMQAAGRIDHGDYASLQAVTPPRSLAPAWARFLSLVKTTATAIRVEATYVRNNNLHDAKAGTRRYMSQVERPIARLKTALAEYAALAHTRLPAWIDELGN